MTKERIAVLKELEEKLGCSFRDLSLLDNALIHRSFINENPLSALQDNEKLEFLGDAVLGLCISDILMREYPGYKEGQLSKLRASLVNEAPLAELARQFSLGDYLLLGRGEEISGGRKKNSLLANTFEALVAAIYLDCGYEEALNFVGRIFAALVVEGTGNATYQDYKTTLQEAVQNRFKEIPQYILTAESGPDHNKVFEIKVIVAGVLETAGAGRSKKEAEQQAAKKALEQMDKTA